MPFKFLDEQVSLPEDQRPMPDNSLFNPKSPVATGLTERFVDNVLGIPRTFMKYRLAPIVGTDQASQMASDAPIPTGRQFMAGSDAVLQALGGDTAFQDNYQRGVNARDRLQEESPTKFDIGNILGDGLSLMAGRAPLLNHAKGAKAGEILAPKLEQGLSKVFKPETGAALARLIGRSGEAALEGAALAALKDEDPLAAAGWSAAMQAGSQAVLRLSEPVGLSDLKEGKLMKGGAKIMGAAVAFGSLLQLFEQLAPGDDDSWQQTLQSGFEKWPILLAAGALAGSTGAGRYGGDLPLLKGKVPGEIADAITTLPRAAWENLIISLQQDDVRSLMRQYTEKPDSMSDEDRKKVADAMYSGELSETAAEMQKPKFRFID